MHEHMHGVHANSVDKKTYASVDELAKDLGIGRAAAYSALRAGRIPSIRIGKRFVIPREAVRRWLENAGTPVPRVNV